MSWRAICARYCRPRHPARIEPYNLDLSQMASYELATNTCDGPKLRLPSLTMRDVIVSTIKAGAYTRSHFRST